MIENVVTVGQRDGGEASKYLRSLTPMNHGIQVWRPFDLCRFTEMRPPAGREGVLQLVGDAGYGASRTVID